MELWPGRPAPLGATYDGSGTNFSIFSEMAERVELCLFDEDGRESRHALPERTGFVWHGYAPEVGEGHRFTLLVDGTSASDALLHSIRDNGLEHHKTSDEGRGGK
jgi:glycogen operon protein